MIRLIPCIDFETDDPAEAYRRLRSVLKGCGHGWETSDEWYGPEVDEEHAGPSDPKVLNDAILKVLDEDDEEGDEG